MSELDQIRENINSIDEQMAQLFQKRMEMSARVADSRRSGDCPFGTPNGSGS